MREPVLRSPGASVGFETVPFETKPAASTLVRASKARPRSSGPLRRTPVRPRGVAAARSWLVRQPQLSKQGRPADRRLPRVLTHAPRRRRRHAGWYGLGPNAESMGSQRCTSRFELPPAGSPRVDFPTGGLAPLWVGGPLTIHPRLFFPHIPARSPVNQPPPGQHRPPDVVKCD